MRFFRRKKHKSYSFDVDTVFLDNINMPLFDRSQKEGTIEQTINRKIVSVFIGIVFFVGIVLTAKSAQLQIFKGEILANRAEKNRLKEIPLFARRGVIEDVRGELLAWNTLEREDISHEDYLEFIPDRLYTAYKGVSHLVGYVTYPKKDTKGIFWQTSFIGKSGIEKMYNESLTGINGAKLIEVDVLGNTVSTNLNKTPINGERLKLSVDVRMSDLMYRSMDGLAQRMGYVGGAGIIMNINDGNVLLMTSYPEYDNYILSKGEDKQKIAQYLKNTNSTFLNKVFQGSYTPGSIIKPFVAIEALRQNVISPNTKILSTGQLVLPNPYNPENPTIFKDWKAHGYTDMREAIAVSSDVYFYQIGGGFGNQRGLGITAINEVSKAFGIGEISDFIFPGEVLGVLPNPEWKKDLFNGDIWRVGDTYNSSIGQYGWKVTPIQMVRAMAVIANKGILLKPKIFLEEETVSEKMKIDFTDEQYKIIQEGLRMTVTDGTATILNIPEIDIAAKTGTAQVGLDNARINSWIIGYFPYENPKYAFAIMMEGAPSNANQSASFALRGFFDLLKQEYPEGLQYLINGN